MHTYISRHTLYVYKHIHRHTDEDIYKGAQTHRKTYIVPEAYTYTETCSHTNTENHKNSDTHRYTQKELINIYTKDT